MGSALQRSRIFKRQFLYSFHKNNQCVWCGALTAIIAGVFLSCCWDFSLLERLWNGSCNSERFASSSSSNRVTALLSDPEQILLKKEHQVCVHKYHVYISASHTQKYTATHQESWWGTLSMLDIHTHTHPAHTQNNRIYTLLCTPKLCQSKYIHSHVCHCVCQCVFLWTDLLRKCFSAHQGKSESTRKPPTP